MVRPNPMTNALLRKGKGTWRLEDTMWTGDRGQNAQSTRWETPEISCNHQKLERGKEDPSPRTSRGSTALLTARFQTSGPQNWETIHSCCFKLLGSLSSVNRNPGNPIHPLCSSHIDSFEFLKYTRFIPELGSLLNFLFAQNVLLPFFLFHDTSYLSFSSQLKCHLLY